MTRALRGAVLPFSIVAHFSGGLLEQSPCAGRAPRFISERRLAQGLFAWATPPLCETRNNHRASHFHPSVHVSGGRRLVSFHHQTRGDGDSDDTTRRSGGVIECFISSPRARLARNPQGQAWRTQTLHLPATFIASLTYTRASTLPGPPSQRFCAVRSQILRPALSTHLDEAPRVPFARTSILTLRRAQQPRPPIPPFDHVI